VLLAKFKGGETRVEIEESVRGKDVFIIQSGGGKGTRPLHPLRVPVRRRCDMPASIASRSLGRVHMMKELR
jgi:hypothetical protein